MRSASRIFAAALLVALLLRLALLLAPTTTLAHKALEPTGDSPEYVRLAANLARGHGFSQDTVPPYRPDILRTPVYPMLLSLPFVVHRPWFLVLAVAMQILLSLAAVWLTWRLGLELGLAPSTSAIASLLVALGPNLIFYSVKLTTEMLFLCLLLLTLLLVNRFRVLHRWPELLAAGICSGLLILTRPIAVFLPILLALYILRLGTGKTAAVPRQAGAGDISATRSSRRSGDESPSRSSPVFRALGSCLLFFASASVVVAPWVVRNGRVTGRYIISTVFDYNICEHTGALTFAAAKLIPVDDARDSLAARAESRFGPLDENDQARYWSQMARTGWEQVHARPLLAAQIHVAGSAGGLLMPIGIRALRVFSGIDPAAGSSRIPGVAQKTIQLVARGRIGPTLALIWRDRLATMPPMAVTILIYAVLFHLALLLSALASLLLSRSRRLLWLLLPILYFVASTGPVGEARFRVPIEPLLCLFAAVGLTRLPKTSNVCPPQAHAVKAGSSR